MSELRPEWADVPAPGRRYDYLLGGKDNLAPDRASADGLLEVLPQLRTAMRENRAFVVRAVRYLAAEAGIRQFLDVGCGLPTATNVHDVAQEVDPTARVVYVDNDPVVMSHARALLVGDLQGVTAHAEVDVRDPQKLLDDPKVRRLDFGQPIGLLLCAVLHFLEDDAEAQAVVDQLVAALPSGSYVVISHATVDPLPPEIQDKVDEMAGSSAHGPFRARSKGKVASYLDGLELVDPGLVSTARWRPDEGTDLIFDAEALAYAAVARVP